MFCLETMGLNIHPDATWHTLPAQAPLHPPPHDSGTPTWLCPTSRTTRPATLQKLLRKDRSRHQLGLQIPQIPNPTQNLWKILEQFQSMEASVWIRLGSDLLRCKQRSPGIVPWSPIHPVDVRSNWDLGNLVDPSAFFPAPGAILKK